MSKFNKQYITVNGEEIPYYRINSDVYGNARYVVHFLDLGVKTGDYGKIKGLSRYRAKWFGGGYVFNGVHLESTLEWAIGHVKEYYNNQNIKNLISLLTEDKAIQKAYIKSETDKHIELQAYCTVSKSLWNFKADKSTLNDEVISLDMKLDHANGYTNHTHKLINIK